MNAWGTHQLDLPGQRIRYALGAGVRTSRRAPLLFLHGGAVDHRMWGPQLTGFPDRVRIAPDARGHGGSSEVTGGCRLTDDVVALLDALEIDRAVLVGVSMGGGTAVDTALEHPDRVMGLVVSGTGTSEPEFTDPWVLDAFAAWADAGARGDAEAWIAAFMRFTTGPGRSRAQLDPQVWSLVETMARDVLAEHVTIGPDGRPVPPQAPVPVTDTWARLGRVQVPVLALCGSADSVDHRRLGRRLAEQVPYGEYDEVTGAHYPNLEDPDTFNAAVGAFLSRHRL